MKQVYVDSSFWYAFFNSRDSRHEDAMAVMSSYEGAFCLSTFVLAETASLLTKRADKPTALEFGHAVRDNLLCEIVHPSAEILEEAWALFASRPEHDFDLVDAISFTIMHELEVSRAFSLDKHFLEMGFEVLPR